MTMTATNHVNGGHIVDNDGHKKVTATDHNSNGHNNDGHKNDGHKNDGHKP